MTDDQYTADDRLDARLRAGLGALVAEAPDPPVLPAPNAGRPAGRRLLVVAAAVVLLVVGVTVIVSTAGRDKDRDVTTTPGEDTPLVGTQWVLVRAVDNGAEVPIPNPERPIDLRIAPCDSRSTDCGTDLTIAGVYGCNEFRGGVTVRDGRLVLGEVAPAAAGCGPDLEPVEAVVRSVLHAAPAPQITGDDLRLQVGDDLLVYRSRAALGVPPVELLDGVWVLESVRGPDGPVEVPTGKEVVLDFQRCTGPDCSTPYRLRGSDGCNSAGGDVEITPGRVVFGNLGGTLMACSGDFAPAVGGVISPGSATYVLDGEELRLTRAGTELRYRRKRPSLPDLVGEQLAAAERNGVEYRLSYSVQGTTLTVRFDHATTEQTMSASTGVDTERTADVIDGSGATDTGAGFYVWGIAPVGTARVTALIGEDEVELTRYGLEGTGGLQAFGTMVDEKPLTVVAEDDAGRELGRDEGL